MNLSGPKIIFDMDRFLPAEGETRANILYVSGDLNVHVFYEKEGFAEIEAQLNIHFYRAKYFFKTPFPGFSFFSCQGDRELSLLNSIVEYEYSDMLEIERSMSGFSDYKHFRLFLHSIGEAIHVIAKSVDVSNG